MTEHNQPGSQADLEDIEALLEHAAPEDRAHFEKLKAIIEAGPETITVALNREQFEAAVYALRCEAHRQDPDAYPDHKPAYPGYDPYPTQMARTADYLEQRLVKAGVNVS